MSKEKLLLVGAGGFGRVVSELAGQKYECAFIDDGIEVGTVICGIPVIGHTENLQEIFAEYSEACFFESLTLLFNRVVLPIVSVYNTHTTNMVYGGLYGWKNDCGKTKRKGIDAGCTRSDAWHIGQSSLKMGAWAVATGRITRWKAY